MKFTAVSSRSILLSLFTALTAGAAALLAPSRVAADPVHYEFTLTVERTSKCFEPDAQTIGASFGCGVGVGSSFVGTFSVATELEGQPDGLYDAPFIEMRVDMGNLTWDHSRITNAPCSIANPQCLDSYRNMAGPDYFTNTGPGFVVQSGKVAGFSGGFIGPGDLWYVDFDYRFGYGARQFVAVSAVQEVLFGSYEIHRVPTPPALPLLLLAAAMAVFAGRRSRKSSLALSL